MNSASTSRRATRRAASIALLLVLLAAIKIFSGGVHPLLFTLYALLVPHTFFSIRCFSALINPRDRRQQGIDAVLVVLYALLAASLQSVSFFLIVWIVFFCVATGKYLVLAGRLPHPRLLKRKIRADIGGIFLGIVFLTLHPIFPFALEAMTGLYAIASLYYLCLNQLYTADQETARRSESQP